MFLIVTAKLPVTRCSFSVVRIAWCDNILVFFGFFKNNLKASPQALIYKLHNTEINTNKRCKAKAICQPVRWGSEFCRPCSQSINLHSFSTCKSLKLRFWNDHIQTSRSSLTVTHEQLSKWHTTSAGASYLPLCSRSYQTRLSRGRSPWPFPASSHTASE